MVVYYLMIEAVPERSNAESNDAKGAFVNLWAKAETEQHALKMAENYLAKEKWLVEKVEEICIANREHLEDADSLDCYDEACRSGIGAVFYIWSGENEKKPG